MNICIDSLYIIIKIYDGWEGSYYVGMEIANCYEAALDIATRYLKADDENSVEIFCINKKTNSVQKCEYVEPDDYRESE